jgi:N4-gp56 family major capsid protein
MAGPTVIAFGDPKAVKRWSPKLFVDMKKKSYFERKFVGESENSVIQRLTDLEQAAGDTISYDLSAQLRGRPTTGDNRVAGTAEGLRFFTDTVSIDQLRKQVSAGGKMTRKRTAHDLRKIGKERLSDYWSKYLDELVFIYLSGARGMNEDFYEPVTYAGHAANPLQAPDAGHIIYGGDATGKADLAAADKMTKGIVERAQVKARMMRAQDPNTANMQPIRINGEAHYVLLMSPFQEYDLRESDTNGWLAIQKAAAAAEGKNNPIFKGGLGLINNTVLHSHESVIRFNDYGGGSDVVASRALFMGQQAGVCAYGSPGDKNRFSWHEEELDAGNEPAITAGMIIGIKKSRFNNKDFGVMAIDTAAADPNA